MITITETKYYIACQDGRYDNREYDSFEEANTAREKIRELSVMDYRSTYITSYITNNLNLPVKAFKNDSI